MSFSSARHLAGRSFCRALLRNQTHKPFVSRTIADVKFGRSAARFTSLSMHLFKPGPHTRSRSTPFQFIKVGRGDPSQSMDSSDLTEYDDSYN
jgi:hypothetical protein